jgi:hypothetical protein
MLCFLIDRHSPLSTFHDRYVVADRIALSFVLFVTQSGHRAYIYMHARKDPNPIFHTSSIVMYISCLLLSTLILALLPWLAPEATPACSMVSKWFIGPDSLRDGFSSAPPIEYIGLESIVAGAASLSLLSRAIAISSIAIDDLFEIVVVSQFESRVALSEKLLVLRNETRKAAFNAQFLHIGTNAVFDRYVL